uniref:Putative neurotoxin LTDF S-16 n=1 Tax=Dolomedes fimbriatus TaxID=1432569 RepID=A0A0K1D8I2_9ARAC|nr:putative neurotoxin LTDF S-16 [Dolomedes fimbriatus]
MKVCIFFLLLLITIVCCEDEILESEINAEEMSAVVPEENARRCLQLREECSGNEKGCCWPARCNCWNQGGGRGSRKCICALW